MEVTKAEFMTILRRPLDAPIPDHVNEAGLATLLAGGWEMPRRPQWMTAVLRGMRLGILEHTVRQEKKKHRETIRIPVRTAFLEDANPARRYTTTLGPEKTRVVKWTEITPRAVEAWLQTIEHEPPPLVSFWLQASRKRAQSSDLTEQAAH